MNDIPYKLKQLRLKFNLNQTQLAEKLGVGRTTIAEIEQGIRPLKDKVKLALLQVFNYNIDTDEFITDLKELTSISSNIIKIPFCRASVAAGSGIYLDDEPLIDDLIFDKRLLRLSMPHTTFENLNCFMVTGDSMVNIDNKGIFDGDILFVDITQKQVFDGIYVIEINNELRVKRLLKQLDNTILIKSDNPAYPTEIYDTENSPYNLSIVGRVVFNITRGNNLNKYNNF